MAVSAVVAIGRIMVNLCVIFTDIYFRAYRGVDAMLGMIMIVFPVSTIMLPVRGYARGNQEGEEHAGNQTSWRSHGGVSVRPGRAR